MPKSKPKPKKKSGMSSRDKALRNRATSMSNRDRAKRYGVTGAWRGRQSSKPNNPYAYEDVVMGENDEVYMTYASTPRRSRSTDSVGRARAAEARRRPKSRKPSTSKVKAKKSPIDFGNR